ncbi:MULTISPECIES: carbamoyltransferase family protein [unclassified Pseudoalteromonas]|uniref:carbamoyltransferase family protein n=1 Tax=unclassified Pseudoalteromonas TaxID=194690 RepID=UPI0004027331|nr:MULTISPECIES: carbamoyltransferase N-terminal domain-containing protein [unclassified Pseudoalteromonas]PCC14202.1 carbamoyltransferase [Pseudoalteromonas sp. JB197]SJN16510.1 Nodulation protein nolO [Pseudoalteromonas sp. JB197]
MKKQDLIVIGLSFGYHDSACCILRNGELLAAAQEERFSRVKNDKNFPIQSLKYCLAQNDISIDQVDCIAYYEQPEKKLSRQLWMGSIDGADSKRRQEVFANLTAPTPEEIMRETLGFDGKIVYFEHHLSHAASSYYYSGFDDAAVLTVDGVGEWATTTYGRGDKEKLELFEEVTFPDSIGLFYSTITSYLGFKVNSGEYKVMGLAPYGEPIYADKLRHLVEEGENGQYHLNQTYFNFLQTDSMYSDALVELMSQPPRERESELSQFHKDVAKSLQVVLEEMLLKKVEYLYSKVPSKNLCMAGGVALNCVANGKILAQGPYENLFVQPAAGDAGTALGAAALAHVELTGHRNGFSEMQQVYLGPGNNLQDIEKVLKQSGVKHLDFRHDESALLAYTAEQLAQGKVVGWCQGRQEFGPRALGARSIIADPRVPDMRARINALVKKREDFRPFAPVVALDKSLEHFELAAPSPFMLATCQVSSLLDLPAITHVDNSARVQTVNPDINPRFAELINRFDELTDCPILLNTSFNVRGEPIVTSAVECIICFIRANIDILVLDDFVIAQDDIPSMWRRAVENTPVVPPRKNAAPGHLVYTFL